MEGGVEPGLDPGLELKVRVYNINKGYNTEAVSRSRDLADYVEFVSEVRGNEVAGMPLREAAAKAVRDCVARGVLSGYLREHGTEVVNMLLTEWDWDRARQVWREEEFAAGVEQGIERGIERGIEQGIEQGERTKALAIARKMLDRNVPLDEIVECTGLSQGDVEGMVH
ncbi:MAG: hypothetical protein LBT74_00530 [Acidobacteriota bacterium]|jgi:hypothetical protein|nr:hypothetical protein [Acidobacteriota bacterium]